MTIGQAAKLEKFAKDDLKQRMSSFHSEMKAGEDATYEKWLSREQRDARIIEKHL